ncbi:MAG: hypothetical protein HYY17_07090 [Planctomycetes bacterium]|nr:hypothetical protein [Planctomycetota bacterium]
MADEVKPPESGSPPPQEGVQSPPPAPEAPVAGGEPAGGGSKKKLMAAAGGVAALVLVAVVIMLVAKSCGEYSVPGAGPKLTDDAEKAGKSLVDFQEEKRWLGLQYARDKRDDQMSYWSGFVGLVEDETDYKNKLKREENYLKTFKENKDKLKGYTIEDVKADKEKKGDTETGRVIFSCNAKGNRLAKSGDTDWKVEEEKRPYRFMFAKIRGKWLVVKE